MSDATKIEWADSTFNPWIGCTKVSLAAQGGGGCDHCYAERETPVRVLRGRGHETWGTGAPRQRTSAEYWKQPLRWNAQPAEFEAEHGRRRRVFCASLADVFDNEVDPAWRLDLFQLIADTPNLDWLLLTKRIGNAARMIHETSRAVYKGGGEPTWPWPNVWLGATVVNQEEADRDIPKLLAVPVRVRFLSMEPLLGPVDLGVPLNVSQYEEGGAWSPRNLRSHDTGLHWVIVGGESGHGARPMHPDWARSLRDQCAAAGVPILFKQWGEWLPAKEGRSITGKVLVLEGSAPFTPHPEWHGFEGGQQSARVGKKAAGRLLDGVEHNGFPRSAA